MGTSRSAMHLAALMLTVFHLPLRVVHLAAAMSDPYTSPQFTALPSDLIVADGQTATLQCGVSGEPPPSVAWFREGGGEVTNGGRYTVSSTSGGLTVSGVELSDEGSYYCVASNAVGSVRSLSAALQLAVFSAEGLPTVDDDIQTQTVSNRQRIVLDCTLPTSLPPASIEWELNQAILDEPDFDSGRMGITLSGKLVISSVDTTTDNGRFYCYASNDVISDSRRYTTGHLLIPGGTTHPLSLPTEFVTTPTSQSVVAGDSAHFDCFTTGTPVAAISWRKDGSPLTSSDHISFSQAARVLTVSPVGSEDAGSYLCVATVPSTGASIESPTASLSVIVPPTMQSSFSSLAANITEEVVLYCEVVASDDGSNIQWVWRVNGSEVVTSGNVLYDRTGLISTLKVLSVMEEDRGVYQCVASLVVAGGDQRQAAANGRLSVILTPPTIITEPTSDLLVFVGVAVSLPCTASGFPPPVFTWARGGGTPVDLQNNRFSLPAEGSGDGTLTISGAAVADSSPYRCTATNTAGFDTSATVQLRVLVGSTVRNRPGDLAAQDGVFTADHGARLSVPCNVTRPEDATTVVYQWYRDGTTVRTVFPDMYGAGPLVLESVDVEDRGRYTCVVEISAPGVGGQPLEEEIGSVTVGVGDLPMNPSAPTALSIAMVTTNTLTLGWTLPTLSGNLPLTGYLVEVMLLGNSLCPQVEPEWKVHQEVDDGNAVGVMVLGLVPFQEYMVRIRANNSAYQSQPTTVPGSVWTLPDSPSAPPSNVEVTPGNQLLTVTWEHPSDCLTYGGPLTDYTVSYRISSESTFVERRVGSNKTTLTLASLRSQTTYVILVSAHTAEGEGPTSDPVETTTYGCSTPAQPTGLTAQPVNSTAALVNWTTPTDPDDLYIVTWCHGDRETRNKVLMGRENFTYVVDLEEVRECVVTVQANNQCGTGKPANITVAPLLIVSSQPVWETVWFIVVVAVVPTLLVGGTPTVIIFIICFFTRRCEGKTYTPSRRSASSLSGASTAFTEFHQKHGGIARASGIKVHSEPPPQRRNTDYADLSSYNSHTSSGPPSISSYQRQSTTETNGGPPSLHHGRETISGDRAPIPPLENFPPGVPEKKKSKRHRLCHYHHEQRVSSPDESADSWSASESMGYPGHVTNHMTDGGSNRDWSGRPTNQLSPLHEHQVMDLSHDQRLNWSGNPDITMGNHHTRGAQHGSQPLLNHSHSPSPPPLPTSLPPPLSLPPAHTCSLDHILDYPQNPDHLFPVSHSHSQFQNPRTGLQNGISQPVLPTATAAVPRPPSPEYAEPKQVSRSHREQQQQKMLAVPSKSRSKQGSKGKPMSSAPNLSSSQTSVELKPVVPPKAPKSRGFGESTSEQHTSTTQSQRQATLNAQQPQSGTSLPPHAQQGHPTQPQAPNYPHTQGVSYPPQTQGVPSYPVSQTALASHHHPPGVNPRPGNNLRGLLTQWKTDQERQERWKAETAFQLNGYPNAVGLLDVPGLPNGSSTAPTSAPSSRPSISSSQNDRWTATPSPQPVQLTPHQIQNSETPIVKNAPLVFGKPPSRTRRNHQDLEDIYQRDPRKPRRRKGRVPGAVWKQMPMNSRIESSSSESDDSDDAASLTSEYV